MPARSAKAKVNGHLSSVRNDDELQRLAKLNLTLSFVHMAHGVKPAYLVGPSRGSRKLSEARQTFQYLSHICFGLSYTELAVFARRDRTSVAHACKVVEDRRDTTQIDRALHFAELALHEAFQADWGEAYDPGQ